MGKRKRKVPHLSRLLPWLSVLVTCATLWFIFTEHGLALIVWEFSAFIYVLSVFEVSRLETQLEPGNAAVSANSWAWLLPLVTSVAGISAAIIAMSANAQAKIDAEASVIAGIAALGVALSWLMLHIGFADVYAYVTAKHGKDQLKFPETASPNGLDYLYFSLTVGATFATSDVTVLTSRMRRLVTLHSVISFFYNALIVAVVFQVLQQFIATNL